jgi:hypothetical protein
VEKEAEATTPTKERKPSMLAGLKSFTQKVRSPSSEQPPAVAAAPVESAAVADAEAPAVATEAPAAAATEEASATNGLTTGATDSKEKRRSSFFNIEAIKSKLPKTEKKAAAEPSTSIEEPAKTEAVEEAVKPAEETPAVEAAAVAEPEKKSSEAKSLEPKVEKETKQSPLTQLGRRVSKVIRGDRAKKETKPVPKVEETSEHAPKLPEPVAEPALTDPSAETEKHTAPTSIGDVVPEAVNVGTAPPASATVSATA